MRLSVYLTSNLILPFPNLFTALLSFLFFPHFSLHTQPPLENPSLSLLCLSPTSFHILYRKLPPICLCQKPALNYTTVIIFLLLFHTDPPIPLLPTPSLVSPSSFPFLFSTYSPFFCNSLPLSFLQSYITCFIPLHFHTHHPNSPVPNKPASPLPSVTTVMTYGPPTSALQDQVIWDQEVSGRGQRRVGPPSQAVSYARQFEPATYWPNNGSTMLTRHSTQLMQSAHPPTYPSSHQLLSLTPNLSPCPFTAPLHPLISKTEK